MNSKHYRPQSVLGPHPSGRTGRHYNFFRPPPATAESSRAQLRTHARTHATQTQAQSKSISRFGCGLTTVSHPQPPIHKHMNSKHYDPQSDLGPIKRC